MGHWGTPKGVVTAMDWAYKQGPSTNTALNPVKHGGA